MNTLEIELYGGPGDGMMLAVPEGTKIWVTGAPQLTTTEALGVLASTPDRVIPPLEYIYAWSPEISPRTSRRIFRFSGQRRVDV